MTLQTRLARLEVGSGEAWLTDAERNTAAERYADTYHASAGAFPFAMTPDVYRTALSASRVPSQQRLLACMLPGDDDI